MMYPDFSPQEPTLGLKWFRFFYTVRCVFSMFTILTSSMLVFTQFTGPEHITLLLSYIFSLPTLFIYPYLYYLYRKIRKNERYELLPTLRDWTYGELAIELAAGIITLSPAFILGIGTFFFLQLHYFKKRFNLWINT